MTQDKTYLETLLQPLREKWAGIFDTFHISGRVCPYHLFENPLFFQHSIEQI